MAKKRPRRQRPKRGPYIAAAVFCESVIEGKDNCLTPVRIIDSITAAIDPSAPPDFPSKENRLSVGVWSVVILKSGDSPGEHSVRLVVESPSGTKKTGYEQVLTLSEPAHGGINLRIYQTIGVVDGGLFWVHVL
ncbi:MAG TPA: hypothetical protein VJ783_16310, partial [Pirellulales bacterium]|nr:hypothetical protein [Pirellulales bacterium]